MFTEARKSRVFQDVIKQIEEAILRRELNEGDRLPSERELTELFKASRGTVREALRVLEEKGLITVKTGASGGAVVTVVPSAKVSASLGLLLRSQKVPMGEIAEFRQGVESDVIALAAERAGPGEIDRLRGLVATSEKFAAKGISGWEDFIAVDEEIHMYLGEIAGNRLYQLILNTIHENITRYYTRLLAPTEERMRQNLEDLREMADAVARRDKTKARRIMANHVRRFSVYMKEE